MEKQEKKIEVVRGKVEAVARAPNNFQGKLSRGVKIGDVWFNVTGKTETDINALFGHDAVFNVGAKVEFTTIPGTRDIDLFTPKLIEAAKQDDETRNLAGLLDAAHKKGILSIESELIPTNLLTQVIFKVTVTVQSAKGQRRFTAHGDANREEVQSSMKEHYIRLAESRALVRALRWTTNDARVADEEKSE